MWTEFVSGASAVWWWVKRHGPVAGVGLFAGAAASTYVFPGPLLARRDVFLAATMVMILLAGICETYPRLRRWTGRVYGVHFIDRAIGQREILGDSAALKATQFLGVLLVMQLQLTGQSGTAATVAWFVFLSKLTQMFFQSGLPSRIAYMRSGG